MRISTLEIFQRGLDGILDQQRAVSDLQLQISKGKRVLRPSDDPVASTRSLILRQDKFSIEQFIKNGDTAAANLGAEEAALKSVNLIYQRIRELALSVANSTVSIEDRKMIVIEMQTRLDELVSLANSRNPDNEYLFSGTLGRNEAVVKTNGQYIYQGDDGQRLTQIGDALAIPSSDTAKDIFFGVPSSQVNPQVVAGLASTTVAPSALVASGSLSTLNANDLILNDIIISASTSDGVSSSDASGSSLAFANAINASTLTHGVRASAQPNVVNLGVLAPGVLAAGDLTLNGVAVVDATGTESSFLATLQGLEAQTGVVATQPGGAGTDIILTAQDGRNIQLQTDGTSAANLANFDLNSGADDRVQRAGLVLRDDQSFTIGGATPANVGLAAGSVSLTNNTGTGVMSQPLLLGPVPDINESYSIVFNAGGTTFDIVADSNPLVPITGFDDVTYVPGQDIEFNGIQVSISGTPNAGDTFVVSYDKPAYQDVFNSIENLIQSLSTSSNKQALSYDIGVAIQNLDAAETRALEFRAKVGARLNVIDGQKDVHETLSILNAENTSNLEDLDYAKAISDLTQRTTALEAAQASYVRIQSLSLFNFLR